MEREALASRSLKTLTLLTFWHNSAVFSHILTPQKTKRLEGGGKYHTAGPQRMIL